MQAKTNKFLLTPENMRNRICLNPRKGIQLINFYDEDRSLIELVNNLELAKKRIPNLYSPRIKTFLMRNYPGFADMPPIIVLAIAAPKMSTKNITALHEKELLN